MFVVAQWPIRRIYIFLLPLSLSPGPPPLETPLQVKRRDETCFPLCYLHNVQQVCQALVTFNNTSASVSYTRTVCMEVIAEENVLLFFCVKIYLVVALSVWFRGHSRTSSSFIRQKKGK